MSVSVATISSIRRLSGKRRSNRGALIAACGVICLGLAITAGPLVVCIPAVAVLLLGLAGRRRPRRSSVEAGCCDETELPPDAARVVVRVVVPIEELNVAARQALAYARAIARDDDRVVAVQVAEEAEWFRRRWEEDQHGVQLVIIQSPYRVLMPPLLAYIDALHQAVAGEVVTVVWPVLVPMRWWQHLLHNHTALRLWAALLQHPGIVITAVPYHVGGCEAAAPEPRANQPAPTHVGPVPSAAAPRWCAHSEGFAVAPRGPKGAALPARSTHPE
jgi:hypothetical protein